MSGTEGLGRGEQAGSAPEAQAGHDEIEIRRLFVTLITFVASARASHDMKSDALDAIQKLQARLLP